MRWGILGPLLVKDDTGRDIRVPGGRLRTLLALLLTRANRPVWLDEMVDVLWDGTPPDDAVRTVRVYITRLRQVLGPNAAAHVLTRSRGYLCEAGEDELDLLRFDALCRAAADAGRRQSWSRAADLLTEALDLWRGAPLADVPSELLRTREAPRLTRLRLQAVEDNIDARMSLHQHAQLIPQLRDLTEAEPLREHLHAQLVRALVRSGRRAEALEAYRRAHRTVIDQLGIEPGPELRDLHRRVLAGDEDPAAPTSGNVSPLTPRQIPAGVRHFFGRTEELKLLPGLLNDRAAPGAVAILAIDGMAGVGKTALAVHAAHRLADHFRDGQLFLDLHGHTQGHSPREPGHALEWLLRALGVPAAQIPEDGEARAALYRQRLADTRTLILLDNARDEAQVRPLLPAGPGCLVLVTSRRRLKGLHDAHVVALDVLPEADALTLLRTVIGPAHATNCDSDLAEIAGLCGRLPLALCIAAALLRHRPAWTPRHLANLLRDERRRLAALADGDHDLRAVFELSHIALDETHRRLFRRLALVPGPDLDPYAAAALLDTDPTTAARLLEDLTDHHLLIEHAPDRYRLHDLIRAYGRTLADGDPPPAQQAALDRLLDYYQQTAGRADAVISRFPRLAPPDPVAAHAPLLPDADAARAWLRTERPNLLAALRDAASRDQHERAVALIANMATVLRNDGPWSEALALHTDAFVTAGRLGNRAAQAAALTQLGIVRNLTGDYPAALDALERASRLYQELGDPLGQANALTQLGDLRGFVDDHPGAVRDLEQALHLYQELDSPLGQANALARLGNIRRYTGDLPGAIPGLEQALSLYRQVGDHDGEGSMLISLGDAQRLTGDFPGASRNLEEALRLFDHLDHDLGRANALCELGELRRLIGDYPDAARRLEQGLRIYQDLGNRMGQANAKVWLGSVRQSTGDLSAAVRLLQAAVDTFRRIGSHGSEAWALNRYAAVISATGDLGHARRLYLDALRLARETGQHDDEAIALEGLGEGHLSAGETEPALIHLKPALEIFQQLGMSPDAERVRARLADLTAA